MKKFKIVLLFFGACFMSLLILENNGISISKSLINKVLDIIKIEDVRNVVLAGEAEEYLDFSYYTKYTLIKSGKINLYDDKNKEASNEKRIISEKISVVGNNVYYFENLSARYGNLFYVIYDKNNKVISYLESNKSSEGEIIDSIRVIMPKNASYFRIACDLNIANAKMFKIKKIKEVINEESSNSFDGNKVYVSYHKGYTLLKNGRLNRFIDDGKITDENRIISDKMYVKANEVYYFKNISAKYGNALYVIYDSNDKVIDYLVTNEDSNGDIINGIKVKMPDKASYFRIACDLNIKEAKMFELLKAKEEIDDGNDSSNENKEDENVVPDDGNKDDNVVPDDGNKEDNVVPDDGDKEDNVVPDDGDKEDENTVPDNGNKDENYDTGVSSLENVSFEYHKKYTLIKSGKINYYDDKDKEESNEKRIISEKISVVGNSIYYFENLSARHGNLFYIIYDKNNKVISYLGTNKSSEGEIIDSIRVIMPKNASYFRIACDLNIANAKMFSVKKSNIKASLNDTTGEPAIISFIDDDCYKQDSELLYPEIKRLGIPYSIACPLDNLSDPDNILKTNAGSNNKYLTVGQVQQYYNEGINILSHHLNEESMVENYNSFEQYQKDTLELINRFKEIGINLSGIAYPNGHINPNYMPIIKENFKFGFTVDREINKLPYESHYIHRYELFPTSGIYDINDAIKLVDKVAATGGWLVFMTHSWYDRFNPEIDKDNGITALEYLTDYIRNEKKIPILSVESVFETYSNPIEKGIIKKPFKDEIDDFFVIDALGRVSTNNTKMSNIISSNMKIYDKSPYKYEEISVEYDLACSLKANGYLENLWDDLDKYSGEEQIKIKKRSVSKFIPVIPNSKYKLVNLSAREGYAFYVLYDSEKNTVYNSEENTVYDLGLNINKKTLPLSDSETGTVLAEKIITIPDGVSYIRIASDLVEYDKSFKLYRVSNINDSVHTELDNTLNNESNDELNNSSTIDSNDNFSGDFNKDGKLTNDDLSILYLYINDTCEFTEEELLMADINKDGKVNNKDWNKLHDIVN